MAENKLADLSMDFAVKILKMTDCIKGHYPLINQLERTASPKHRREYFITSQKAGFVASLRI